MKPVAPPMMKIKLNRRLRQRTTVSKTPRQPKRFSLAMRGAWGKGEGSSTSNVPEFIGEGIRDDEGDEMGDVSAEAGDFFDEARRDVAVFLFGHEEECFEPRLKAAIHEGHLELKLEVAHRTQPTDDRAGFGISCEFDEETVKGCDAHILDSGDCFVEQRDAFFGCKESALFGIERDSDDDLFAQFRGALDHVEVAVGDGIKGACVDCAFHGYRLWQRFGIRQAESPRMVTKS